MALLRIGCLMLAAVVAIVLSLAATGTPVDEAVTELPCAAGRLAGLLLWIGTPVWFISFANLFRRYVSSSPRTHRDEAHPRLSRPKRSEMLGAALICIALAVVAPRLAPSKGFFERNAIDAHLLDLSQVCLLLAVASLCAVTAAVTLGRWRLASRAALVAMCSMLAFGWAFSSLAFISLLASFGVGMSAVALILAPLEDKVFGLLFFISTLLPFIYISVVWWAAYAAWRMGPPVSERRAEVVS